MEMIPMTHPDDYFWMRRAIAEAKRAAKAGEVPIGAVLVHNNKLIARGQNRSIRQNDPTAHAEIVALRRAARRLKNYRLSDTILYVTVEPCPMCAAAIVLARVKRVIYGTPDSRCGAAGTVFNLLRNKAMNHTVEVVSGVCLKECQSLIQDFFQQRRT